MIAATEIKVTKAEKSKLNEMDFNHLPFGKYFTDHMLEANYENGEWKTVEIKPYQPMLIEPSLMALHYGQAIFEGIKAFKGNNENAFIFRPYDNWQRFNISAERMCMPPIPQEIFIEGMKQIIALDINWIPAKPDHSLYIRPFMFSTDCQLGVKASETYKFMIILSPAGPYFAAPMKIFVEEKYTRAAPGGVGFAKNAGNYGGSLIAAKEAKNLGYDQVLWTDAVEHKWLQEVGMMNVFFVINGKAITPSLEEGTILDGVTRKTLITLMQEELQIEVEQRRINIDELVDAFHKGLLSEVFGSGTAATVALIKELRYKETIMEFDTTKANIATTLKNKLDAIRSCTEEDKRGWMVRV